MSKLAPKILTVVFADTYRTRLAVIYEGDHLPYSRRTVQIELTPEQRAALRPRHLGIDCGNAVFEEMGGCWFEPAEDGNDE